MTPDEALDALIDDAIAQAGEVERDVLDEIVALLTPAPAAQTAGAA
jgi:hypothetical protein